MNKKLTLVLFSFVLIASVVSFSGCFALVVGAAAGAGAAAWINGDLEENFDASVDQLYDASLRGLRKLELSVISDSKDKHNARIRSKYSDGQDVLIDISSITERAAKIKIRVGTFGDQARSEAILTAIKKYLP